MAIPSITATMGPMTFHWDTEFMQDVEYGKQIGSVHVMDYAPGHGALGNQVLREVMIVDWVSFFYQMPGHDGLFVEVRTAMTTNETFESEVILNDMRGLVTGTVDVSFFKALQDYDEAENFDENDDNEEYDEEGVLEGPPGEVVVIDDTETELEEDEGAYPIGGKASAAPATATLSGTKRARDD